MLALKIDHDDPHPVFRQIADEIRRSIAVGVLKPEDALPAVRELAAQLKVNANTVQHAYRTLEQAEVVVVRRGRGTFVAAKQRESKGRQVIVARQIAERMLREGYRHGILPSDLMAALKELTKSD